jgi:phage tail-like protein
MAQEQVFTNAVFYVQCGGYGIGFSELSGIEHKVDAAEYQFCDEKGNLIHTKQFGKHSPPGSVKLKRAVDQAGLTKMLAWHAEAAAGNRSTSKDATFKIKNPGNGEDLTFTLTSCWVSSINVSSAKAGDSAPLTVEVTLACEDIRPVGVPVLSTTVH